MKLSLQQGWAYLCTEFVQVVTSLSMCSIFQQRFSLPTTVETEIAGKDLYLQWHNSREICIHLLLFILEKVRWDLWCQLRVVPLHRCTADLIEPEYTPNVLLSRRIVKLRAHICLETFGLHRQG